MLIYGKLIFETSKNITKIVKESLGYIRQVILDDSLVFLFKSMIKIIPKTV